MEMGGQKLVSTEELIAIVSNGTKIAKEA